MAGAAILLSLLALGLCYYLFTLHKNEKERVETENLKMLEGFLAQLEEENQRLMKELRSLHDEWQGEEQAFRRWVGQTRQEMAGWRQEMQERQQDQTALPVPPVEDEIQPPLQHIQGIADEIVRLKGEGYSVAEIAKRLSRGIGEVELIVNLTSLNETKG